MTFVGMIGKIQAMACGIAKQWGDKFAVNELVNEAWVESLRNSHTDPPLIMRAAQCDMMDYIRTHVGRKYYVRNGKKVGGIFKPKYMTNLDTDSDNKYEHMRGNSFFDRRGYSYLDKNLKKLENKELIELLLSTTTTRNATAMVHYYLEEHNMKEAAALMGIKECTMSSVLKKGRKRCKEVVDILELSFAEI